MPRSGAAQNALSRLRLKQFAAYAACGKKHNRYLCTIPIQQKNSVNTMSYGIKRHAVRPRMNRLTLLYHFRCKTSTATQIQTR